MNSVDTTPTELAHQVRQTVGLFIRRLRAEPGPPVSQHTVLGRLERDGAASISELAAAERMRPQSMAQIVRELEEAGLVHRRPDPDDARRAFVELTPAGIDELARTRAARDDWLAQSLDRTLDPNERELLARTMTLLRRIAES